MSLYLSVFVYLALKLPSHYTEMVFLYREASNRLKDDLYSFWARVPPPPKEKSPLKKKTEWKLEDSRGGVTSSKYSTRCVSLLMKARRSFCFSKNMRFQIILQIVICVEMKAHHILLPQ